MPSSRESFHHVGSVTLQPWPPDPQLDVHQWQYQAIGSCCCCQKLYEVIESNMERKRVRSFSLQTFLQALLLPSETFHVYVIRCKQFQSTAGSLLLSYQRLFTHPDLTGVLLCCIEKAFFFFFFFKYFFFF